MKNIFAIFIIIYEKGVMAIIRPRRGKYFARIRWYNDQMEKASPFESSGYRTLRTRKCLDAIGTHLC